MEDQIVETWAIHNRIAPELLVGLSKVDRLDSNDRARLRTSLDASGATVGELLHSALAAGGRVKGFKPPAVAFRGYLIDHKTYHQGDIGVVLTQSGHPLDRKTAYGMWEWGTR
jgi:hypothetical protein